MEHLLSFVRIASRGTLLTTGAGFVEKEIATSRSQLRLNHKPYWTAHHEGAII